jgi:ABC-type lipoprotein export system ATPase subunit
MKILPAIAKERDRAVLVVTHDARLSEYADRIFRIEDGTLWDGAAETLEAASAALKRTVDAATRRYVSPRSASPARSNRAMLREF